MDEESNVVEELSGGEGILSLVSACRDLARAVNAVNNATDKCLPDKLAGIVKLHSGIAVGTALVPIPVADVLAAAGNIWTMYVRINKEVNLPFSENLIKSIATGVVTNLAAYAVGGLIVGSIFKLLPGIGTVGGCVVVGATVYGVTVASGIVYMNAITKVLTLKKGNQTNENDLRSAVDEVLQDKQFVKSIYQDAKNSYKKES